MIVTDLSYIEAKWTIQSTHYHESKLHKKAVKLIKEIYTTSIIFENVPFKPYINRVLFFDICIVPQNIFVEVDGSQHFEQSSFFHKNVFAFIQQQKNDRMKKDWCKLNKFKLINLSYKEKINEWKFKFDNQ